MKTFWCGGCRRDLPIDLKVVRPGVKNQVCKTCVIKMTARKTDQSKLDDHRKKVQKKSIKSDYRYGFGGTHAS